jgi:hypothetical protein
MPPSLIDVTSTNPQPSRVESRLCLERGGIGFLPCLRRLWKAVKALSNRRNNLLLGRGYLAGCSSASRMAFNSSDRRMAALMARGDPD